jgi:hypothetical protein
MAQADTNGNDISLIFTGTGAMPVVINFVTTAADPTSATSFGLTNLDAAVTSRMATYTQPTGFLAATFPTTVASTTNITAGTVTTATNVTTVNGLAAGVITAASIAADAITDAKVASDVTIASVTGAVGSVTGAVGSVTGSVGSVTGAVGSVTGNVGGSVASVTAGVTVTTNNDKTGYALSGTQTFNVTGNITGSLSGSVGSVTGLTAANLDVAVSTRLASAGYTAPDNSSVTAIKAKTDSLTFSKANELDANVKSVAGTTVTGTGATGDEWGP